MLYGRGARILFVRDLAAVPRCSVVGAHMCLAPDGGTGAL